MNRLPGRARSVQLMSASSAGGDEPPDLHEERVRFWWAPPDRLREEVESGSLGQTRTTVVDGELWWFYTPDWGAVSNVDLDDEERAQHGGSFSGERFRPLLDPSGLLAALDFDEITETGERLRVRARPREDLDGPRFHLHLHVVGGADEYELEVDRKTGTVRRLASFLDGRELAVTELTELALDEELPPEVFVFTPPPGVEVLPPEPRRHRQYTLEEAADAAPFPVFYVPELPEGDWRLHVHFSEARVRPPTAANVALVYHRADGRGALMLMQRAAGGEGGFGWTGYGPPELETVERGGVAYTVARADPERGGQHAVQFERDGTAIQLQSGEVGVDTLLGLAESLRLVVRSS